MAESETRRRNQSYQQTVSTLTTSTGASIVSRSGGLQKTYSELITSDNPIWRLLLHYRRKNRSYKGPYPKLPALQFLEDFLASKNIDAGNGAFSLHRTSRHSNLGESHVERFYNPSTLQRRVIRGYQGINLSTPVLRGYALDGVYWPSDADLTGLLMSSGTRAIARSLPMQSQADLAVSLAELLREGLPKIISLSLVKGDTLTRGIGSEYLNYQFGIAPIVSDIQSIVNTVKESLRILHEFHNRYGKHYRRRFEFPNSRTDSLTRIVNNSATPIAPAGYFNGSTTNPVNMTRSVRTKTWFSGAFIFAPIGLPDHLDQLIKWEEDANRLYGLRFDLEALWNLTPWTWLIDWFLNLGDVVKNISSIGRDGLLLEYGYIMQSTTVQAQFEFTGNIRTLEHKYPMVEYLSVERKMRRKATPYGFGLNPSDFTDGQWAILGALGMTKAPKTMW